jgi:hypothetical protein
MKLFKSLLFASCLSSASAENIAETKELLLEKPVQEIIIHTKNSVMIFFPQGIQSNESYSSSFKIPFNDTSSKTPETPVAHFSLPPSQKSTKTVSLDEYQSFFASAVKQSSK